MLWVLLSKGATALIVQGLKCIEFVLGYSKSNDYRAGVRLQLKSVLFSMGPIHCDCNHYTIIAINKL